MREIKFRIYDKKYSMFDYNESPELFISTNGEVYEKEERSYAMTTFTEYDKADHYILMQYTGLKDENGEEIYENDLLYDPVANEHYIVVWDDSYANFFLKNTKEKDMNKPDYDFATFDVEVCNSLYIVGNIYENPIKE